VASLVVNTFLQAFLEVLHHSLQHVGRNRCHFFPDVLFQIHRCPWFHFVHLALEISSEEEVLRLGTLVPMNIEVPTKYPLSQDRIVVFEIRLHSENTMPYRPALHGKWNALSLARRALKDKLPTPTVSLKTVLQNRQVFLPDPRSLGIYWDFSMVRQPPVGQVLLIFDASRSYWDTPRTVRLLWTSDQPDTENSTSQQTTLTTDRHPCPPARLKPKFPASKRPETQVLDRGTTWVGLLGLRFMNR